MPARIAVPGQPLGASVARRSAAAALACGLAAAASAQAPHVTDPLLSAQAPPSARTPSQPSAQPQPPRSAQPQPQPSARIPPPSAPPSPAAQPALSAHEARGRRIFLEGGTPDGAGVALIGAQSLEVPASRMPCASCHGPDGTGRPEGGVLPPDITWPHLSKPYGHAHPSGRTHGAFDAASLARAIADGIDPAGNRLDAAMPRYRLTQAELADLLAFLQRLGTIDLAPGLDDTTIRVATLLPANGPMADAGRTIRAVMAAYFDEINAQGGIFGRRIELVAVDRPQDARSAAQAIRRSLADVFAVVGALVAGAESDLLPLIEAEQAPLVGPVTLFPASRAGPAGRTFYLLSGIRQQAVALVDHAAREAAPRAPHVAVVHPAGGPFGDVVQAVGAHAQRHGWAPVGAIAYRRLEPARVAAALAGGRVDTVLFLGSGPEWDALRAAAAAIGWAPRFLASGSLTDASALAGQADATLGSMDASAGLAEAPTGSIGAPPAGSTDAPATSTDTRPRALVAYPMLPSDQSDRGRAELQALLARHGLSSRHLPMQIAAYGAAKVLVEGLKAAGRDLTRERLVGALEKLDRFDTGLTPPISYGPNRRIGALGAHVLAVPLPARRDAPPRHAWVAADRE